MDGGVVFSVMSECGTKLAILADTDGQQQWCFYETITAMRRTKYTRDAGRRFVESKAFCVFSLSLSLAHNTHSHTPHTQTYLSCAVLWVYM